jgi:hypothetical protein
MEIGRARIVDEVPKEQMNRLSVCFVCWFSELCGVEHFTWDWKAARKSKYWIKSQGTRRL